MNCWYVSLLSHFVDDFQSPYILSSYLSVLNNQIVLRYSLIASNSLLIERICSHCVEWFNVCSVLPTVQITIGVQLIM